MKYGCLMAGRRCGAAANVFAVRRWYSATTSASLRSLTLKLGQSGSFALPVLMAALLCLLSLTGFSAETNFFAKLQDNQRIVFLGDSITYAGGICG